MLATASSALPRRDKPAISPGHFRSARCPLPRWSINSFEARTPPVALVACAVASRADLEPVCSAIDHAGGEAVTVADFELMSGRVEN